MSRGKDYKRFAMKKIVVFILLIAIIATCAFALVACDDGKEKEGNNPADEGIIETDLSVDLQSDVGLYFLDDNAEYVRYSKNLDSRYFDKNKPTIVYFHGWLPGGAAEGEIAFKSESVCKGWAEQGYNVCVLDYARYAKDLETLFEKIWIEFDGSHSVGCRFAKEFIDCFADYENEIRFVSHSFGAHSALATAYITAKMYEKGVIEKNIVPTRMTFADPYLGDIFYQITGESTDETLDGVGEKVNGKSPTEVFADCMQYLANRGVVMDVYAGMPFAYDQFLENEPQRRTACKKKLYDNAVWTILVGMQNKYGKVGDIHNLTLDWVFESFFAPVKEDENGFYPTAVLDDTRIKELKGKLFNSTLEGLDVGKDVLVEVKRNDEV